MAAVAGLVLALVGGPGLVLLALVGLGIGLAYDLWAKGTTLSWLPFAVGVPLLPVYGWYGATGEIPGAVPGRSCRPRRTPGPPSPSRTPSWTWSATRRPATAPSPWRWGPGRASGVVLALQLVVAVLAVATTAVLGAPTGWVLAVLAAALVPLGGAVLGIAAAAREGTGLRELAFEAQAVGTGLLAVAWLCALSASQAASGA